MNQNFQVPMQTVVTLRTYRDRRWLLELLPVPSTETRTTTLDGPLAHWTCRGR